MSWFRAMRPAIGPVRISEPPRRARTSPVRAARTARKWGPRELNPAGLCGRRVYSAPRLPYRSRAPLLCSRRRAAESRKATEWSPPSGTDATLEQGRLPAVRPGSEAAAIAAEARKPGRVGLERQCFVIGEVHHDVVPGG